MSRRGGWSEGGKMVLRLPSAADVLKAVFVAAKAKGRPVFSEEIDLPRSSSTAKRRMLEQLVARGMIEVTVYRRIMIAGAGDREIKTLVPTIPGVFIDWRYPHIRSRNSRAMFSITKQGEAVWRSRRSVRNARRPGVKDAIKADQAEADARFMAWFTGGHGDGAHQRATRPHP